MRPLAIILIFLPIYIHGSYLDNHNLKPSLIFSRDVQKLRDDIQSLQADSLLAIDESFFDFYNSFSEEVHRYIPQLFEIYDVWKESCEAFPMTSLNAMEKRKLTNVCDDTERFMRKLLAMPEIYLKKLYSGHFNASYPAKVFEIFYENLDSIIKNETVENLTSCIHNIRYSILMNYEVLVNETIRLHDITKSESNRYTRYFSKFVLNFVDDVKR